MTKILREKNNVISGFCFIVFVLAFSLIAQNVSAATLSFKINNSSINVGDTVAIDVFVDTEGQTLNVIEGNINISSGLNNITIKELSTANSALNYWVRNPSWSEKDGIISFIGGAPGGFKQSSAPIFRIYMNAKASGEIVFTPAQLKAYANDGLASPVQISFLPLNIEVNKQENVPLQDDWKETLSRDLKAPAGIQVELGQDSSLFDGLKFINISASDLGSGIDHFEVKEGERSPVRTSGTYVLQNQEKLEPITIFAYDKSGNISKKDLVAQKPEVISSPVAIYGAILLIAILALLSFIVYKIIKKRRK